MKYFDIFIAWAKLSGDANSPGFDVFECPCIATVILCFSASGAMRFATSIVVDDVMYGLQAVGASRVSQLLAPLSVGDRIPWKLDRVGEPQWLVAVGVISATSYRVRYPDGGTGTLVNSE